MMGLPLPKLPTPLADSFVGHDDPTGKQQFFNIVIAEADAVVQPDTMTDNLGGKAVILVALGVGRRGMSGYLSWGSMSHGGVITGGIMSWVRKQGQQLDNAHQQALWLRANL